MTWLASMPETKMLIWVALAAMAPGMASSISALHLGREPAACGCRPARRRVARPTSNRPAWATPAITTPDRGRIGRRSGGSVCGRTDDQGDDVEQGRRGRPRRRSCAPGVQHARQSGRTIAMHGR